MWVERYVVDEIVLDVMKVEVGRCVDVVGGIDDVVMEIEVVGVVKVDIMEDGVGVIEEEVAIVEIEVTEEEVRVVSIKVVVKVSV